MSIHTLRKRFVKDASLPIQVMQSPYFEYFLDLYDPQFQCKSRYEQFLTEVELLGGEEKYLSYSHNLIGRIANHVQEKEAYQHFNDGKNTLAMFNSDLKMTKENIYNVDNHEKRFLSIDLQKANFNALRYVDPSMVDHAPNYDSWISTFTPYRMAQTSKHVRQVIFGNLNPSRQIKVQKYLIHTMANSVANYFEEKQHSFQMKSASSDEIVIELKDEMNINDLIAHLQAESERQNISINIEVFTLKSLVSVGAVGYVKEFIDGRFELKTVPDIFMAQTFKRYLQKELQEEDFIFYHEGRLAKFI